MKTILNMFADSWNTFKAEVGILPKTKPTLEEARNTSVKNVNPTTYDRYDPIYGLHAE